MGPIGIIIGLITAAVAIFVKLYKENDAVRASVDSLIQMFSTAAGIIVNAFKPAIDAISEAFDAIMAALMPVVETLWTSLVPVFTQLVGLFISAVVPIVKMVAAVIAELAKALVPIVTEIANFLIPIITALVTAISKYLMPVLQFLIRLFIAMLKPAFEALVTAMKLGMALIMQSMKTGFAVFKWVWNNLIAPPLELIKDGFDALVGFIGDVVTNIGEKWKGIKDAIREPLEWVVDKLNKWLINPMNTVIGAFGGTKIKPIELKFASGGYVGNRKNFASGGAVRGPGTGTSDSINAKLSNGEYVLNAATTKRIGLRRLDSWNYGRGGPWDTVKSAAATVWENTGGKVSDWVSDTAKSSINAIVNKALNPLIDAIPFDNVLANFIKALLRRVGSAATSWGSEADKKRAQAQASAQGSSRVLGPYKGPPGAWTWPANYIPSPAWTTYPSSYYHRVLGAIDIPLRQGTPIRAATAGRIARTATMSGYGNVIFMTHAGGMQTVYAHLSRFVGRSGNIPTGAIIAYSGGTPGTPGTGRSTGAHLHFEILPNRNGYGGAAKALRARGVKFAQGGIVHPTPGGLLSIIGEAGKKERVEPLDSSGMSERDRAIIREIMQEYGGGAGGGTVVRVYIGDRELRDIVKYEVVDSQGHLARSLAAGRRR